MSRAVYTSTAVGVAASDDRASVTTPTRGRVAAFSTVVALTATELRVTLRDPGVVMQAVVFPAFLLAMFHIVFAESNAVLPGGGDTAHLVGLVALVAAVQGTLMTGIHLVEERDNGLLSRQWTLPTARTGFVASRLAVEAIRIAITTMIVFIGGAAIGFRFDAGVAAGVAALAVPVLFGLGWAIAVIAIATVSARAQIQQLGVPFLLMMFFTTGFAPVTEYPGWLQPVVEYQPMSTATDALAGLTSGGPVAVPLALTAGWTLTSALLLGPLAVRGYRRAAEGSI